MPSEQRRLHSRLGEEQPARAVREADRAATERLTSGQVDGLSTQVTPAELSPNGLRVRRQPWPQGGLAGGLRQVDFVPDPLFPFNQPTRQFPAVSPPYEEEALELLGEPQTWRDLIAERHNAALTELAGRGPLPGLDDFARGIALGIAEDLFDMFVCLNVWNLNAARSVFAPNRPPIACNASWLRDHMVDYLVPPLPATVGWSRRRPPGYYTMGMTGLESLLNTTERMAHDLNMATELQVWYAQKLAEQVDMLASFGPTAGATSGRRAISSSTRRAYLRSLRRHLNNFRSRIERRLRPLAQAQRRRRRLLGSLGIVALPGAPISSPQVAPWRSAERSMRQWLRETYPNGNWQGETLFYEGRILDPPPPRRPLMSTAPDDYDPTQGIAVESKAYDLQNWDRLIQELSGRHPAQGARVGRFRGGVSQMARRVHSTPPGTRHWIYLDVRAQQVSDPALLARRLKADLGQDNIFERVIVRTERGHHVFQISGVP